MNDLVPYEIIIKAINEDIEAIQFVMNHYKRYMETLSAKKIKLVFNEYKVFVDQEKYDRLERKLLQSILRFKV